MSSVDFKAWCEALERAELRMEAIEQAAAQLSVLTTELREVRDERRSFECKRAARHEHEIEGDPGGTSAQGSASRAPRARAVVERVRTNSGAPDDVTLARSPAGMSSRGTAPVERQVAAADVAVCAV